MANGKSRHSQRGSKLGASPAQLFERQVQAQSGEAHSSTALGIRASVNTLCIGGLNAVQERRPRSTTCWGSGKRSSARAAGRKTDLANSCICCFSACWSGVNLQVKLAVCRHHQSPLLRRLCSTESRVRPEVARSAQRDPNIPTWFEWCHRSLNSKTSMPSPVTVFPLLPVPRAVNLTAARFPITVTKFSVKPISCEGRWPRSERTDGVLLFLE